MVSSDIKQEPKISLTNVLFSLNIIVIIYLSITHELYVWKALLSERDMENLQQVTGCSAELQRPSCDTDCLSERYRSITGECNNRFLSTQ